MFTATFKAVEAKVVSPQVPGDANPPVTGLVTLQASLHDDGNKDLWGGAPNGALQLGNLPAPAWSLFSAGRSYRVTVEPL